MTLLGRWNYQRGLENELPPPAIRVLYAKSGTFPTAALLRDQQAVIDHAFYWAEVSTISEGRYLTAIFNSETARARVAARQSRGQWGARHFDKVMLELPIPRFDPQLRLHQDLSAVAEEAERLAATVELRDGMHFVTARRAIRNALAAAGIAQRIDALVDELLAAA